MSGYRIVAAGDSAVTVEFDARIDVAINARAIAVRQKKLGSLSAEIDQTNNVFKISGEQVNKGLELSVVGELVSGLTVSSGGTLEVVAGTPAAWPR